MSEINPTPAADTGSDMSLDEVFREAMEEEAPEAKPLPKQKKREDKQSDEDTSPEAPDDADEAPDDDDELDLDVDDEGSEEDDEDKPELHRVKIDGEEMDVTYDELIKGYQLSKSVNKKSMALAEERKSLEREKGEVAKAGESFVSLTKELNAKARQYTELSKLLETVLTEEGARFSGVEWDNLAQTNPSEWVRLKNEEAKHLRNIADLKAKNDEAAKDMAAARQLEVQQQQQKLVGFLNENFGWSDAKRRDTELGGILKLAKDVGFSEAELANTADPRAWQVLRDAYRYREAVARSSKAKGKAQDAPAAKLEPVKIAKATARPSQTTQKATEVSALKRQASISGSIDDVFRWDQAERSSAARRRA